MSGGRTSGALTLVALALAPLLVLVGCGSDDAAPTTTTTATTATTPTDAPAPVRGAVTVSAAASLTDVFAEIGDAFTAANPDAEVTFNFGSSGQLSIQILQGAPADVAAFADTAPMEALASASLLGSPAEVFATNRLVLVTPPDDPVGITGLADLPDAGTVALCAAAAPCGKFAAELLAAAGVALDESGVTRGQDVRATLAAVTEGDADAAIVYVTDATAAGDAVRVVQLPEADEAVATYPIAALAAAADPEVAAAFVAFVLGPAGRELLGDAGFGLP